MYQSKTISEWQRLQGSTQKVGSSRMVQRSRKSSHHINHKYLVEAKSSFRIFLSPIFRAVQERKNIATSNVRLVVTPLMLTISKAKVRLFCKAHLSLG
jgi:hypothetical protein